MKGIATVLIVLFVLICLGALLVTTAQESLRRARIVHCAGNLSQLWKMEYVYMAYPEYGGPEKIYPTETGGAFWLKLTQTNPPLIDDSALSFVQARTGRPHSAYRSSENDRTPFVRSGAGQ